MKIEGATLQFRFPEIEKALSWYSKFFGRPADFVSSSIFQEWRVFDEFWIQITKGEIIKNSLRLRYGVPDVEATKKFIENCLKVELTDKFHTPGVVLLYNFKDPWGYKLGIFQDLQKYPLE